MDKSALSERSKSYIRQAQYDPERQSNGSKGFTPYRLVQGFTLIELLVTIAIIAILTVIGIVLFTGVQKGARDSRRKADIDAIAKAYEVSYSDGLYYPLTGTNFAQGAIPQKPEGGDYDGMLSANAPGFQVCAALEANPSRICAQSASDCFCKQSAQGTYVWGEGGGNEFANPSTETDSTSWIPYDCGGGGTTITRTTDSAYIGSYSIRTNTTAGVSCGWDGVALAGPSGSSYAGKTYTFSAYVNRSDTTANLAITILDYNGSDWQGTSTTIPKTFGWQIVSVTRTFRPGATQMQWIIQLTTSSVTTYWYTDGAQIVLQ